MKGAIFVVLLFMVMQKQKLTLMTSFTKAACA